MAGSAYTQRCRENKTLSRPTVDFVRYLLGRRPATTTVTATETALLAHLASGLLTVVEVGVFEGATSAHLAEALHPSGRLYLVDPFVPGTRPERLLGLSYSRHIAQRSVAPWRDRVCFLRSTSIDATREIDGAELIFIDADHGYEAVKADFLAWSNRLAPDGVLAFHDSRLCAARPDLQPETGPVRLLHEILAGEFGAWNLAAEADSVAAIRRAPPS